MGRQTELKDKTRNLIFAAAIDEIRRREGKLTQLALAKRMGVNKDTITNVLHFRTAVTDDIITRLQTASGCIFNLQWLRGESDVMLAEQIRTKSEKNSNDSERFGNNEPTGLPSYSSMANSIIAAKDDAIESLKRELAKTEESSKREIAAKDETIGALRDQLATKETLIKTLKQQVSDLRAFINLQQTKDNFGNYPFTPGVADEERKAQT